MKIVNSVSAIIIQNNQILLVEEFKQNSAAFGGKPTRYYGLPNGKVDKDQSAEQALVAEIAQETGAMIVDIGQTLYTIEKAVPLEQFQLNTTVIACRIPADTKLQPNDPDGSVKQALWVNIADAITLLEAQKEIDLSRNMPLITYLKNDVTGVDYKFTVDADRRIHPALLDVKVA